MRARNFVITAGLMTLLGLACMALATGCASKPAVPANSVTIELVPVEVVE